MNKGETPVTCTAGVGTYIVEFGALSRLTGDSRFEDAALRALEALYESRSEIGLVGNHINTATGIWTATEGLVEQFYAIIQIMTQHDVTRT